MKGLVVASVACAFTLIAARANAGFISNGLVAYWKLNDHTGATAADNGKGFPMTLLGSPSWGGNFLTLNGSTQYRRRRHECGGSGLGRHDRLRLDQEKQLLVQIDY